MANGVVRTIRNLRTLCNVLYVRALYTCVVSCKFLKQTSVALCIPEKYSSCYRRFWERQRTTGVQENGAFSKTCPSYNLLDKTYLQVSCW